MAALTIVEAVMVFLGKKSCNDMKLFSEVGIIKLFYRTHGSNAHPKCPTTDSH